MRTGHLGENKGLFGKRSGFSEIEQDITKSVVMFVYTGMSGLSICIRAINNTPRQRIWGDLTAFHILEAHSPEEEFMGPCLPEVATFSQRREAPRSLLFCICRGPNVLGLK